MTFHKPGGEEVPSEREYENLEVVAVCFAVSLGVESRKTSECRGFMQVKELVERIIRALVDLPEEVDVQEVERSSPRLLEIRVPKEDMGRIIGRKGKNIDAIRLLVSAAGRGRRYTVKVLSGGPLNRQLICKGKIKRLFQDRNYGFIEADDGRAVYFHGSSLRGTGLHSLSLHQPVEFEVVKGSQGIKALKVVPTLQLIPIGKSIDRG